jgi:uncharacterized protein
MAVADSSPLIFLGRIGRLALIERVAGEQVVVPEPVRKEVLAAPLHLSEKDALGSFLSGCEVVAVARPRRFAAAMSRADNAALTLAFRRRAGYLPADDRILRRAAAAEGIRTLGTLGVLLRAMDADLVPSGKARALLADLIRSHGFRIGIEVYQVALGRIAERA